MIFVVVGTQAPFDRMVQIIDEWAEINPAVEVVAQIGHTEYQPKHLKYHATIPPVEFNAIFEKADVIIGHAGMGTILTALQLGKPIITMARLSKFREHRNDHQVHTARSFKKLGYIKHAESEDELKGLLNNANKLKPAEKISKYASEGLIKGLKEVFETSK